MTRAAPGRAPTFAGVEDSGAYPEREDTFLLLPFARSAAPRTRLLDLGTGNGRLALEAARAGARVVATDLNPRALRRLADRARVESLPIDIVRTDLARGLGRFDRVLANPPYLPTRPAERDPDRWANLALDGGPDGCRISARILRVLPDHLTPGGVAFLLVSSLQDRRRMARLRSGWQTRGGSVAVVAHRELEGEQLEVWALSQSRRRKIRPPARRARGPRRGTVARPRSRSVPQSGSNPAPVPGRTPARGGALGRRRSPRGS